ncbi:hypothetical protein Cgig2_005705 [Carnegiea gigantea]|uniref:Telomere repeat-binding protein 5 n=1 Tax=Carnegiea gigantea TaxID=171969 RepID=A0A9Q1KHV6_9CARY|nr:hypothetical protein Cgig2_005705 [Carnegiea gigantea]
MVVLKRTLDNGMNGYPSTAIPRAPRSIRVSSCYPHVNCLFLSLEGFNKSNRFQRRGLRQKAHEGGQICAFELLATVAGKLLEESECSSASSSAAVGFDQRGIYKDAVKKEPLDINRPFGGEHDDQGSSEGSVFFSGIQKEICKAKLGTEGEATGEHLSPFPCSGCSDKLHSDPKSTIQKNDSKFVELFSIIEGDSPKCRESDDTNVDNKMNRQIDINRGASGDSATANKSPALTNSEEKIELPLFRDSNPNASFVQQGDDVKLGCKDDDEILSQYSLPNSTEEACRSPTYPGDRKIRKFLSSIYWKTAPKLKDYEVSNSELNRVTEFYFKPSSPGGVAENNYQSKRSLYELDRSQRNTPFKKRKLFDRSSVVTQDGGISCGSVSNSPVKSGDDQKNGSAGKLHEGNRTSSLAFASQKSCNIRNSNGTACSEIHYVHLRKQLILLYGKFLMRLSIKSFSVPELFIEVPETTTIGLLKRAVLEAVTTKLCGGLRVGVLLHGKKIRDDSRTLLHSGISQNASVNAIEFMLEPNAPAQTPPSICHKDPPAAPLSCDSPKFVNRCQVHPKDEVFHLETPNKPTTTDSSSPAGSCGDLVPSPTTDVKYKNVADSRALVPVLEANMEALAVMPGSQRPKRSEIGRRRTRRPFSVSEVEALVQAVEKLGTGRWRDVKLCAFENAKHRTYVDLKDKWKTLVHTARISPQQRRGEPVPQELLDRVLAAQAYWSERQAKQHGKQQQQQAIVPKLADFTAEKA